ncbi:MAG: DUF5615 family PIN-like protein [Bryobacteraceae bacterium]|nr:DUF5615 family PIN-like protein [Bryobacteraceae bacterium]
MPRLVEDLFPGSQHVREVELTNSPDLLIWDYARRQHFAIVSKDADFYDRAMLIGAPPKVIFLQVGNCGTNDVARLIRESATQIMQFGEAPQSDCLLLAINALNREPN